MEECVVHVSVSLRKEHIRRVREKNCIKIVRPVVMIAASFSFFMHKIIYTQVYTYTHPHMETTHTHTFIHSENPP